MKLLEILLQELPKRGGWPASLYNYALLQVPGGGIYQAGGGVELFVAELADDWNQTEITREQYERALAASNPEWDGEGLPPVGGNVEVLNSVTGRWYPVRIVYSSGRNAAWIELDGGGNIDSSSSSLTKFRPIRSQSDKKRDEIIDALKEGLGHAHGLYDLMQIYQLLNNGKIPHIRID